MDAIHLTQNIITESIRMKELMFDEKGELRLMPTSFYRSFSEQAVRLVCLEKALYVIPTVELVKILHNIISGRAAIEICSGNNYLHRHLGITGTDACSQKNYETIYAIMGQPITRPPSDVMPIEAEEAVRRYRPKVVIGAFSTQRIYHGDPIGSGSEAGVRHEKILDIIETLVLIGNFNVHGNNKVLTRSHETIRTDCLITRASDQSKNAIWVFHNRRGTS